MAIGGNKMSSPQSYLKRIPIFLASPSDLNIERKLFHRIIDEINRIKAKSKGLLLEAVVWEDCLIGKGRPQEKINEELRQSNLVVMLLWKKWGTPSGKYSSGFEEEYELASENDKDIMFFFREVPNDMLVDPGEQLKQVTEFEKKIEIEKNYFYSRYKDEKEWERKFKNNLSKWLDQMRSHPEDKMELFQPQSDLITGQDISQKMEQGNEIKQKIAIEEEIKLENIANPMIRIGDYDIPYHRTETKDYLSCSLFGYFLGFSKGTYSFHAPQKSMTNLDHLEKILKKFYDTFGDYEFDNSSFIINQTCFEKKVNYSWFGFGPKNFVQAIKEQSKRYSEARIVKPHHREVAGFVAQRLNFLFYIALQPDVIKENSTPTFDYMQVGFIFGEIPFDNRKFIDFYKGAGLEEPDLIEKIELDIIEKDLSSMKFNYDKEGFLVYKNLFDSEHWVSKVILKNPFYGDKKIEEYLYRTEKLIVNLTDHHPLEMQKNYFLRELKIIPIPYYNFPFVALSILGNW